MLKKIEKVKDFSFIRKGPIITETFSIKFKVILPPPLDVCLSFLLLFTIFILLLRKKVLSPKTSQQSVRNPYRPLLLFNISLHISKHDTIIIKSSERPIYAGLQL